MDIREQIHLTVAAENYPAEQRTVTLNAFVSAYDAEREIYREERRRISAASNS